MEKNTNNPSETTLMAECMKVLKMLHGIKHLINRLEARIRAICPNLPPDPEEGAGKPEAIVAKVIFHKDYSKSQVRLYLAHPEDADRILAWLHLQMDGKNLSPTLRIKPLCALLINDTFSTHLSKKAFESEFGKIDTTLFSRYFSRNRNGYDPDELAILYKAYLSFDFVNYSAPQDEE